MSRDRSLGRADRDRPNWRAIAAITTTALAAVVAGGLIFDVTLSHRRIGLFGVLSTPTEVVLTVAGVITQFGDPWFLLLTGTIVYLVGSGGSLVREPREGAFVLAVTLGAFALTDLLKNLFLAPRPPGAGVVTVPVWLPAALTGPFRSITTGTGYAFPSGHALGTAAVFAALAYRSEIGSRAARWSVAAIGVALVAASRIVLGVHFLADIVVGMLAGLSLFAVAAATAGRRPLRAFALGAGLGVLAVLASAGSPAGEVWKAGQWLGGSLGAGIAWHIVRPSRTLAPLRAVIVAIPIGVLWIGIYLTAPPPIVTVVGTAIAAGATVSAPSLAARAMGSV